MAVPNPGERGTLFKTFALNDFDCIECGASRPGKCGFTFQPPFFTCMKNGRLRIHRPEGREYDRILAAPWSAL